VQYRNLCTTGAERRPSAAKKRTSRRRDGKRARVKLQSGSPPRQTADWAERDYFAGSNLIGTLSEPVLEPTGRTSATHIAALSKPAAGVGASRTLQPESLPSAAVHSSITLADALELANFEAQEANCSAKLPATAGVAINIAQAAPARNTPNFFVLIFTHPFSKAFRSARRMIAP
jgi:hypothetical protein